MSTQQSLDSIDQILLNMMLSMGFHDSSYSWFKSYLSSKIQTVVVDGFKSSPQMVDKGVPYGSTLGLLLYTTNLYAGLSPGYSKLPLMTYINKKLVLNYKERMCMHNITLYMISLHKTLNINT